MISETKRRQTLKHMGITLWLPREATQSSDISTNFDDWGTLAKAVRECTACHLCKTRTQTVFGVGNKSAELLIIGEAPGFYEDKQGEPFVGKAGHLLDAMLRAIELSRKTVYIANILKCRPPDNRDPNPEEVEHCTPFLKRQIDLIQPKLILAVGRIAAHFLLNSTTPLGRMRGQQYRYNDIPLLVTYHPAYLLRNPSDKRKAWQDLLAVKHFLENHSFA